MKARILIALTLLAILLLSTFACGGGEDIELAAVPPEGHDVVPLEVTSTAFDYGGTIPTKYTDDGDNVSPPVQWGEPPEDTKTFALVVDDPDASGGTWIHWLVFNLPVKTRGLAEGVTSSRGLPSGAVHGKNTWGDAGYGGPDPPSGTHHYYFRIYALDRVLDLEPGIKIKELVRAMEGHVLGYGEVMGVYSD